MRLAAAIAVLLAACGGAVTGGARVATLRPACSEGQTWNGTRCTAPGGGAALLERGRAALSAFQVEEAVALLERARSLGPHPHREHAAIYEQLGVAQAYLEREPEALAAFDMLLALDPGHLLSYTLSPKATFLFERARTLADQRVHPELQVQWPRGLAVARPIPVDIEVVADPKHFLRRASLFLRRRGQPSFSAVDVELPAAGGRRSLTLPAVIATRPEVVEVYLSAFDDRGNEVLRWGDPTRPREMSLSYQQPVRWWRKWWVWAAAGGVIAAGTGAAVFFATREPSASVPAIFETD